MNTDQTTRRTQNLKLLQGLTKFNGAPKSKHMVLHFRNHNVPIDSSCLSNIYLGKKDIDDSLVPSIEKAFGLPKGWLDGEHEYFTKTSQVDREDIARLLHLDPRTRNAISELLQLLSSARQPRYYVAVAKTSIYQPVTYRFRTGLFACSESPGVLQ